MWNEIAQFGFRALWSPYLLLVITSLALLYWYAIGSMRERWFQESAPVPLGKQISMIAGLTVLYMALGGPIDLLGHLMFSWHMLSMAMAYLIAPPLILYGMPDWMLRRFTKVPSIGKFVRRLTNPILTLILFNMLFSFYHMPVIHDFVMTNYTAHTLYYIALLIAALMMWWNVICPLPEYDRLTDVKKMGYVFANGVLLTPACALIIFAGAPLFATYTDPVMWARALGYCVPGGVDAILAQFSGPETIAPVNPRADQQLGGIIMKFVQEIMYGAILFYNFRLWYRRENPSEKIDPIDSIEPGIEPAKS